MKRKFKCESCGHEETDYIVSMLDCGLKLRTIRCLECGEPAFFEVENDRRNLYRIAVCRTDGVGLNADEPVGVRGYWTDLEEAFEVGKKFGMGRGWKHFAVNATVTVNIDNVKEG